jgi:phosphoribosylamine--glycine ligase
MLRLQSDLVVLVDAALDGELDAIEAEWDPRPSLGVVMAAGGYPGSYTKGDVIEGLPVGEESDRKVFHAGTALKDGNVVTSGGRVLCVTALGATVGEAQRRAYETVKQIRWSGAQYRTDIGYRAIARERAR